MAFPYIHADLAGVLASENCILMQQDVKILMKQLLEGLAYLHRVSFSLTMFFVSTDTNIHTPFRITLFIVILRVSSHFVDG
jgi:hypothetical protein